MNSDRKLYSLTAGIIASYLEGNHVTRDELPSIIGAVGRTVAGLGEAAAPAEELPKHPSAARIRKSIQAEVLISFEDGKSYKHLKRHLTRFGLSPDEYRAKWGLSAAYPMVAPGYSAQRSAIAKSYGLGRKAKLTEALASP